MDFIRPDVVPLGVLLYSAKALAMQTEKQTFRKRYTNANGPAKYELCSSPCYRSQDYVEGNSTDLEHYLINVVEKLKDDPLYQVRKKLLLATSGYL